MLEEAYYYGLTPQEATELTLTEMVSFISAKRKYEMRHYEILAKIGYSAGIVASSTFDKRRPRFDELFDFPKENNNSKDIDKMKAQMLVWASNNNRIDRKYRKEEKK